MLNFGNGRLSLSLSCQEYIGKANVAGGISFPLSQVIQFLPPNKKKARSMPMLPS